MNFPSYCLFGWTSRTSTPSLRLGDRVSPFGVTIHRANEVHERGPTPVVRSGVLRLYDRMTRGFFLDFSCTMFVVDGALGVFVLLLMYCEQSGKTTKFIDT